jgi:hypothetical protein
MAIRTFILEQQPTELLIRRLQTCPTDRQSFQELCRRGESTRANATLVGEREDRMLEGMGTEGLTVKAFALDQEIIADAHDVGIPIGRAGGIA